MSRRLPLLLIVAALFGRAEAAQPPAASPDQ